MRWAFDSVRWAFDSVRWASIDHHKEIFGRLVCRLLPYQLVSPGPFQTFERRVQFTGKVITGVSNVGTSSHCRYRCFLWNDYEWQYSSNLNTAIIAYSTTVGSFDSVFRSRSLSFEGDGQEGE